ncbi:MAG: replication-relaxation family protein [Pseudomonadota bacterium]
MKTRAPHKKYKRSDNPPGIRLTSDDDRILLEVYRHDVIDSKTIYRLFPERTNHKISGRLHKLHDNEFLQRLSKIEEIRVEGGGSLPTPYMLDRHGMQRLHELHGLPSKYTRPQERARRRSAPFILHDVELSKFMVSLHQSAKATGKVDFLYPDEIYRQYAPEILEQKTLPRVVRSRVKFERHAADEGTIPDGFCMLVYKNIKEKNRRSLFIEIDRGHATIDPTNRHLRSLKFWSGSSILRKFIIYSSYYRDRVCQKEFGIPTFQVLTVTTTPDRVKSMQDMWAKRLSGEAPANRFLFTDFETMAKHGDDYITLPIEDATGKLHSIAPKQA